MLEVRLLALVKTNDCEFVCQGCFHWSRTKVRGSKTIRYRPARESEVICSMVARLKLQGIDGRAPPGVEFAAQFDSTRENSPGSDVASGCLFLLAQCPSVLIFVWSSATLSSGGLSSRAGSPFGTWTLLMHSCSQPSGTPLEESAAWNDQGWMWPSQLWLVSNSPSVTSSGRGPEKTVWPRTNSWKPSLRAETGFPHQNFGGCHRRLHSQLPRRTPGAQQRRTLCGEAGERRRRSLRMEYGHPEVGRGHLR